MSRGTRGARARRRRRPRFHVCQQPSRRRRATLGVRVKPKRASRARTAPSLKPSRCSPRLGIHRHEILAAAAAPRTRIAHSYAVASVMSYVGFYAVDSGWAVDVDAAGFVAGLLASAMPFGRIPASTWGAAIDRGTRIASLLRCQPGRRPPRVRAVPPAVGRDARARRIPRRGQRLHGADGGAHPRGGRLRPPGARDRLRHRRRHAHGPDGPGDRRLLVRRAVAIPGARTLDDRLRVRRRRRGARVVLASPRAAARRRPPPPPPPPLLRRSTCRCGASSAPNRCF